MTPRSLIASLMLATACGSSAPAPTTASPVATAPAPTAPVAEAVGPDGPADIGLPEGFSVPSGKEAVAKGAAVFIAKGCGGCHKFEEKLVGPPLAGLGERRTDAWIAKMILHPEDMTKKDPVAKDLYRSIMTQMTNQGVGPDEVGPLIAYLKSGGKE